MMAQAASVRKPRPPSMVPPGRIDLEFGKALRRWLPRPLGGAAPEVTGTVDLHGIPVTDHGW